MSDYTRMFEGLEPWKFQQEDEPSGPGLIRELRRLAAEVVESPGDDHLEITAAYTYFAQFLVHDLSFTQWPHPPARRMNIEDLRNARTPRLDLDCLYGRGPVVDPALYDPRYPNLFAIARTETGEADLPRTTVRGRSAASPVARWRLAVIGDPRNDENVVVAQLHLAFLRLHNHFFSTSVGVAPQRAFRRARRLCEWHYQWVVLHDLLPKLCSQELVDQVLGNERKRGLRFFDVQSPGIPIEFAFAAFRLGHSMVRERYRLNAVLDRPPGGELPIFHQGTPSAGLIGGRDLPPRWTVQWDLFIGPSAQKAKRIDSHLAPPLGRLQLPGRRRSLPLLTMRSGVQVHLPSGPKVAERLGVPAIDFDGPLWLYFLKEAEILGVKPNGERSREAESANLEEAKDQGGQLFGPAAARIVAETIIGLLLADPNSYLVKRPRWRPDSDNFGLKELLELSGSPMTREDLVF